MFEELQQLNTMSIQEHHQLTTMQLGQIMSRQDLRASVKRSLKEEESSMAQMHRKALLRLESRIQATHMRQKRNHWLIQSSSSDKL